MTPRHCSGSFTVLPSSFLPRRYTILEPSTSVRSKPFLSWICAGGGAHLRSVWESRTTRWGRLDRRGRLEPGVRSR
jgi:hypothetical protein